MKLAVLYAGQGAQHVVKATIPKIFNITEIKNICKKVKLYIEEA